MTYNGGGYAGVVRTLLAHGAQVNEKDENGLTPLHKACFRGSLDAVKILLEHGHPIDEKGGRYERTPLHLACEGGNIEVVVILLDHKHPVNVKDRFGITPLHVACDKGTVGMVEMLLLGGAYPEEKDQQDRTPLDKACNRGNVDMVKILLHHGARINGRSGNRSQTPLHRACGSPNLVKFLLGIGVSVTEVDALGQMPLHVACTLGDVKVVKALLERGAPVNIADTHMRMTPLHKACDAGNVDVVQVLLENGANVGAMDAQNDSALNSNKITHFITAEVMTCLLDYKVGVDVLCRCFRCKTYSWQRQERSVRLADVYERHIIKTKAAGVHDLGSYLEELLYLDWSQNERDTFRNACLAELEIMKKYIVENTNISYYGVLRQNLSALRNHHAIKMLPPEDLRLKFPIYGNMIYCSYINFPLRSSLLDRSCIFLDRSDLPRLPPECVLEVLKFLSDEDLKRIIQVYEPKLYTTKNDKTINAQITDQPVPAKKSRCGIS